MNIVQRIIVAVLLFFPTIAMASAPEDYDVVGYYRLELTKEMQRNGATRQMLRGLVPGADVKTGKSVGENASNEFSWAVVRGVPDTLSNLLTNYGMEQFFEEGGIVTCKLSDFCPTRSRGCYFHFGSNLNFMNLFYDRPYLDIQAHEGGNLYVYLLNASSEEGYVRIEHGFVGALRLKNRIHVTGMEIFPDMTLGVSGIEATVHTGEYLLLATMDERRKLVDLAVIAFK